MCNWDHWLRSPQQHQGPRRVMFLLWYRMLPGRIRSTILQAPRISQQVGPSSIHKCPAFFIMAASARS